jgi:hypothetical protein
MLPSTTGGSSTYYINFKMDNEPIIIKQDEIETIWYALSEIIASQAPSSTSLLVVWHSQEQIRLQLRKYRHLQGLLNAAFTLSRKYFV